MVKQKQTKADVLKELPPKYITALYMLMSGATVKEAAEAVGLHRQQLSKAINQNAHVKAAYMQLRAEAAAQIGDGMRALVEKSIKIVADTLDSEETPQDVRFNAAMTVLARFAGADITKAPRPQTAREIITAAETTDLIADLTDMGRPSDALVSMREAEAWEALKDGDTDAA